MEKNKLCIAFDYPVSETALESRKKGMVELPDELLRRRALAKLSDDEFEVLEYLFSVTYGEMRNEVELTPLQIVWGAHVKQDRVLEALKSLGARGLVRVS